MVGSHDRVEPPPEGRRETLLRPGGHAESFGERSSDRPPAAIFCRGQRLANALRIRLTGCEDGFECARAGGAFLGGRDAERVHAPSIVGLRQRRLLRGPRGLDCGLGSLEAAPGLGLRSPSGLPCAGRIVAESPGGLGALGQFGCPVFEHASLFGGGLESSGGPRMFATGGRQPRVEAARTFDQRRLIVACPGQRRSDLGGELLRALELSGRGRERRPGAPEIGVGLLRCAVMVFALVAQADETLLQPGELALVVGDVAGQEVSAGTRLVGGFGGLGESLLQPGQFCAPGGAGCFDPCQCGLRGRPGGPVPGESPVDVGHHGVHPVAPVESCPDLEGASAPGEFPPAGGAPCLAFERAEVPSDLRLDVADADEILLGLLQPSLGAPALELVARNAGGLFDEGPPLVRASGDDEPDAALLDDRVGLLGADAGAEE